MEILFQSERLRRLYRENGEDPQPDEVWSGMYAIQEPLLIQKSGYLPQVRSSAAASVVTARLFQVPSTPIKTILL